MQDVKATLVDAVQREVLLSAHSMNMLLRALVRAQAPAMAAVLFYRSFPQNLSHESALMHLRVHTRRKEERWKA